MAQIRTSFSVSYRVRKTSALNATVAAVVPVPAASAICSSEGFLFGARGSL